MAKFFIYPFGEDGTRASIPDDTQPSGSVSYQSGFTSDYQKNLATDPDAKPIPRDQTNQLYYDITNAIRQYQTEGVPDFITSADNGGAPYSYDIYARVRYDAGSGFQVYESLANVNTALPTDGTKWAVISGNTGGVPTGSILPFGGFTVPSGFLLSDGSAVNRSTYSALFAELTVVQSGVLNSTANVTGLTDTSMLRTGMYVEGTGIPAGTTITIILSSTSVTLSASATASATASLTFFANANGNGSTTFNLPDLRRRTMVGSGGSSTSTLKNTVGAVGGSETNTLAASNLPPHTHPAPFGATFQLNGGGSNGSVAGSANRESLVTDVNVTTNDPVNNIQPSYVCNWIIKT